ncbi:NUDIX hydrolase domain-like protein [Aspergillus pseudoustus]|uniref:NUDIX hydrolase domain-like protein n=1 Tax=Aspergillus pseudoustus TaxID=1810923 RepID=A0ABR4IY65_9EURO
MSNHNVRVGVAVFALNSQNEFVLGQRMGSHGAGTWALPGGHLEFNESFEDCATREVKEETGLDISDVQFLTATNDVMSADEKHYVTVFVGARVEEGQVPEILEPAKCAEWRWVSWKELEGDRAKFVEAQKEGRETEGKKLFIPLLSLFEQRGGFKPALKGKLSSASPVTNGGL